MVESSSGQYYNLRWNNHQSNLLSVFDTLLQNEELTDVTLAVDGGMMKCHKMVLAACSPYFQELFHNLPCKHPVVVFKDVKMSEIKAVIEYMYRGEVHVAQEQLGELLKVAEVFKVKGLVDPEKNDSCRRESTVATSSHVRANSAVHSSGRTSPSQNSITDPREVMYSCPPRLGGDIPLWQLQTLHTAAVAAAAKNISQERTLPYRQHQLLGSTFLSSTDNASSTYDVSYESPEPKRKKSTFRGGLTPPKYDTPILRTVLRQNHSDSPLASSSMTHFDSIDSIDSHYHHPNSNYVDNEARGVDLMRGELSHNPYADGSAPVRAIDEDEKQHPSPSSYAGDSKSDDVPHQQKPDWKRYKQYTKENICDAINDVKNGMSAVQSARKHGVPSRTLYDKVKKLGITTSRPSRRTVSNNNNNNNNNAARNTQYPGISTRENGAYNTNGSHHSALSENENENNEANASLKNCLAKMAALEVTYSAPEDLSQDREEREMTPEAAQRSPTQVIRCSKQEQDMEDEVEDLSVNRKSDVPVIAPPLTPTSIKEEKPNPGSSDKN